MELGEESPTTKNIVQTLLVIALSLFAVSPALAQRGHRRHHRHHHHGHARVVVVAPQPHVVVHHPRPRVRVVAPAPVIVAPLPPPVILVP